MATSLPKSKQWKLGTLALLPYDIDLTNDMTIGGTLAVTGASTLTGNVAVTGNLTVTGNITGPITTAAVQLTDANYTVLAVNSGKVHLVPNVSADRTISLPTAAAGLYYEFVAQVGAADGHDWIIDTGSDTNFYLGGVLHVDDAPAANGIPSNGSSNSILQVNLPEGGTRIHVYCDGTNWTIWGTVVAEPAPAFSNQP